MKTIKQLRYEIIEANLLNEQKKLLEAITGLHIRLCMARDTNGVKTLKVLKKRGEGLLWWANALLKAFKKLYYSYEGRKYLSDGSGIVNKLSDAYKDLINVVYC